MSEDIHKWTSGRYTLMFDEHTFFVFDNEKEDRMCALDVTKKLNEQQATITSLQEFKERILREINTELNYLEQKGIDNPVNSGRIRALKDLKREFNI